MNRNHLTDRMPDVRHGRDAWTAGDLDHLAGCRDCAAEWRLVRAVSVQGTDLIDTDRLAAVVLARLRESPAVLPIQRRPAWRRALLGLAAAASIAVAFLVWPASRAEETAFVPSREATMLPELDALLDAELEVVLATIAVDAAEPIGDVPRIGDLTDEELEQLLEEVEG